MNKIISLAVFGLILVSCSPKVIPYQRTGEVNAVSHENSIVTVSSVGRAGSKNTAIHYAERNAFENILFKGVPNTNQESPLIPDENTALRNNEKLISSLLTKEGYLRYIMDSYTITSNNSGGVHVVDQSVKIDIKALRKYLESQGILKKFGL